MSAELGARLSVAWRRARRRPPALAGALVVLAFAAIALTAPWLATADPVRTDWSQIRKAPSWTHPFGTDDLGRDIFSRVVWGTRISMQAGVLSVPVALGIRVAAGLLAGYHPAGLDSPL